MKDVAQAKRFYTDMLGFTPTETVTYKGHTCEFLRANTEHHAVALYPLALREELGLSPHTTNFSIGLQVANYRQLRDARDFLKDKGCTVHELPAELFPGIDYHFFVRDPDGHAVQLYYYMEQVGWDGKPRPAAARRKVAPGRMARDPARALRQLHGRAVLRSLGIARDHPHSSHNNATPGETPWPRNTAC